MHVHLKQINLNDVQAQSHHTGGTAAETYFDHSTGRRINTDAVMVSTLRKNHPHLAVTTVPIMAGNSASIDFLTFASATGQASYKPLLDPSDPLSEPHKWTTWQSPAHRSDTMGTFFTLLQFGKYEYWHAGESYLLYVVNGRDGDMAQVTMQYLLHRLDASARAKVDMLIRTAGQWASALHEEIWVFDAGRWVKDAALFASVASASWDKVILDEEEKRALQNDVSRFFDSQGRYERLGVPWKRGVIYHGPPGNGKTVSIKAMMHELCMRRFGLSVPTLYVRSLTSYGGPEFSVRQIFGKARTEAPCLLVFEDLDTIVTEAVRSYFLNEVDGLAPNDGIYMVGSTNHLDKLDPGLAKRPSRFDRKFYFPTPDREQRRMYADFWRRKLERGKDMNGEGIEDGHGEVEFPEELYGEIARITDGFSFAYMQEAFVAALLAIAAREEEDEVNQGGGRNFEDLILWREFQRAVKVLRDEM